MGISLLALALLTGGGCYYWLAGWALTRPAEPADPARARSGLLTGFALGAATGTAIALTLYSALRQLPTPADGPLLLVLLLASTKYVADYEGVVTAWLRPEIAPSQAAGRRISAEVALGMSLIAAQMLVGVPPLSLLVTRPFPALLNTAFAVHLAVIFAVTALACKVGRLRSDREGSGYRRSGYWSGAVRYSTGLGIQFALFHLILWAAGSPWLPALSSNAVALLCGVGFVAHIALQSWMALWATATVPETSRDAAFAAEAVS